MHCPALFLCFYPAANSCGFTLALTPCSAESPVSYFFTVNCTERHGNFILTNNIDMLRKTFLKVKNNHPFNIDAIVVLPDHLHCIWTLPPGDADYKTRWALIKAGFSRAIPPGERRSVSRVKRGGRGIWQRRYWEHLIRDNLDFEWHVDYIHPKKIS